MKDEHPTLTLREKVKNNACNESNTSGNGNNRHRANKLGRDTIYTYQGKACKHVMPLLKVYTNQEAIQ